MVIDVGNVRELRRRLTIARFYASIVLGVTMSGIIWDELAVYALAFNAAIWLFWAIDKSGQIRELAQVQGPKIHDRRDKFGDSDQ